MMHKKLNIGFYLPDVTNAQNSGGLTFFVTLLDALKDPQLLINKNVFIFCENLENAENLGQKFEIIPVSKKPLFRKKNWFHCFRFRIGYWLHRLLTFLYLDLRLNHPSKSEITSNNESRLMEDLIDRNSIDLMIYANQFELPTVNRPYIWILWDIGCQTINFFHKLNDSPQTLSLLKKASSNAFRIISGNQTGAEEISFF